MTITEPDSSLTSLRIGIVGPCTAGKSTLIQLLTQYGITARHIAQEHSYVPYMWQRLTNPDVLIFLDVSYPVSMERRKINWNLKEYQEQQRRLAHARAHTDCYILTDPYTADEVASMVMEYLVALRGRSPQHPRIE
jgi:ATPase subunit of ABC transporter with duplicated ATPase domains